MVKNEDMQYSYFSPSAPSHKRESLNLLEPIYEIFVQSTIRTYIFSPLFMTFVTCTQSAIRVLQTIFKYE